MRAFYRARTASRGLAPTHTALAVGPYRALNFPWILLDRAIGTFAYVINRAHGRRVVEAESV